MRFGKLFKLLFIFPEFQEDFFSSNKFSQLPYAELRTVAKILHKYGYWYSGDYTHLTTTELASDVYTNVNNLYNQVGPDALVSRFVPRGLQAYEED